MTRLASPSAAVTGSTTRGRWRDLIVGGIVTFSAAISVFFTSDHLFSRSIHRADTVAMQFALLEGKPYPIDGGLYYLPSNQNRVLFAAVLAATSHLTTLSAVQWFALLRFGTALMLFATAWHVMRRTFDASLDAAAAGVLLLAYGLTFTFSPPYAGEYTSDFLDGFFTAVFVLLAVRRRRLMLLATALVAASNRESAAFAGVIWWCCHGLDGRWRVDARETSFSAVVSFAAYAMVIAIRYALGGAAAVGSGTQLITGPADLLVRAMAVLRNPQLTAWPVLLVAAAAPAVLWIRANRAWLTTIHKRLLIAAAVIAVISLQFGAADELRVLIPSWVLLVLVAAASSSRPQPITAGVA